MMSYSNIEIKAEILEQLYNNYPSQEVKKITMLRYIKTPNTDIKIAIDLFDTNGVYRTCNIPYIDFGINLESFDFENFDSKEDEHMLLFNYTDEKFVSIPIISITSFADILGNECFRVSLYNNSDCKHFEVFDDKNNRTDVIYLNHGYNTILTQYIKKDYTNKNFNVIDEL